MNVSQLRLINLPWQLTRQDLSATISKILNTRVRYSKIIYDRRTGLSRGTAIVRLESDRVTKDALRRGNLDINGRNVIVIKNEIKEQQQQQQQQ